MILHHPLAPIPNTFGIAARAQMLIEYNGVADLRRLYEEDALPKAFRHIGQGSNLLFTTDPWPGTIMHNRQKALELMAEDDQSVTIRVSAGYVWDTLVEDTISRGWYGLENLSGIPGEVGSAAVQNIGAYGVEVCQRITAVEVFNPDEGDTLTIPAADLEYAYRYSMFKRPGNRLIVTWVQLRLTKTPQLNLSYRGLAEALKDVPSPTPADVRLAVTALRNSKLPDPHVLGNAGSFFKNPVVTPQQAEALLAEYPHMPHYPAPDGVKLSAAWLIDSAGWKGRNVGHAGVYERQPLVLVNLGDATGQEIKQLAQMVIADVDKKFGVRLSPEVNIL